MSQNMENTPAAQPTPNPAGQPQPAPTPQPPVAQPQPAPTPQPTAQVPAAQPQPATLPQAPAVKPTAPTTAQAPTTPPTTQPTAQIPAAQPAPTSTQPPSNNNNNNGKKKKKKKRSDWGGRLITAIISIILGFVLGVGSVFGTVAAIVYSIGTQPVDETVELVDTIIDPFTDINLSELLFDDEGGILSEKYAGKKIMDLVGDVALAIQGLSGENTTIKNITDISPYVGVQLKNLVALVQNDFGIPLDYESLQNTKITGGVKEDGSLLKQLLADLMKTELGTLLQTLLSDNGMNSILKALCYGKEGIDYVVDENGAIQPVEGGKPFITIGGLMGEGGENVLFELEIATLLDITEFDPTNPVHSILFKNQLDENGNKVLDSNGNPVKVPVIINDLLKDSQTIINGIEIAGILGATTYDPADPIHAIIFKDVDGVKVPVSVGDFVNDSNAIINNIKIAEILGETVYDPTNQIHAILFKDVDGEKTPVSVGDFVNDSTTIINGIKLAEILGETTYDPTNPIHAILFKDANGEKTPVSVGDFLNDSNAIIHGIKLADILGATEYNPDDPIHAILFKDVEGEKVPVSVGDFVNDSAEIIDNIKIAEILGETTYDPNNPMHAILFKGDAGNKVPVSVGELTGDFINAIKIAEILGETTYDPTNPMHAILYKDGVDGEGNPVKVPVTIQELDADFINAIKIAEILGETTYDPTNPMHAILYKDGADGVKVPITIDDLTGDFINAIKIAEILGETTYDPNNPMHAILFKDGVDSEGNPIKVPLTLEELDEDFINDIQVAGILGETTYDPNNPMHAILYKNGVDSEGNPIKVPVTIKELDENFINNIAVADILGINPNDDNALTSILFDASGKPLTISELSSFDFNTIKLADVIELKEGTNPVLLSIVFKGNYTLVGEDGNKKYVPADDDPANASRTLGEITADMTDIINGIKLEDVIDTSNLHPALKSIVYKEDGTSRTILELSQQSSTIINTLKLSDVLELKEGTHKVLLSIVFKGEYKLTGFGENKKYVPADDSPENAARTLQELSSGMTDIVNSLAITDVLEVNASTHPALLSIVFENGEYTIDKENNKVYGTPVALGSLSTNSTKIINGIKLADVIDTTSEGAHPVLKSLVYDANGNSRKLGDLADATKSKEIINGIKLADVMNTDDPMLKSIIYVDGDPSKPRTLADLATPASCEAVINSVKLADVLNVTNDSHKALIFLAYGTDTVDSNSQPRTLGEIRNMGDSLINDIPLGYIITPNLDDGITSYLIYGTKGIHYQVVDGKLEMLQRYIAVYNDKVYNEYGEKVGEASYTLSGNTYTELNGAGTDDDVVYTLVSGAKTQLTTADGNTATVYYLTDGEGNAVKFEESTLHDLAGGTNMLTKLTARLTLKDVLGGEVEGNKMLKYLADTPIDQLSTKINDLTFEQVFEEDIYVKNADGQFAIDVYGNRILKDVWHYMLTDKDTGKNGAATYKVLGDMDKLLENMKHNVHEATLSDLKNDGILNLSDSMLETKIILKVYTYDVQINGVAASTIYDANTKLGDLTTEEMIIYIDGLLTAISNIPGV